MSDVQSIMEKLGRANSLMEDLIDLAMADNQISDDEKQMLFSINDNLAGYARAIIETVSDGVVDEQERANLKSLEEKIISDARDVAEGDSNISDDEKALLNQLISVIQSMS